MPSSTDSSPSAQEIEAAGTRLLGEPIHAHRIIAQGRNSFVAQLTAASGQLYALKRHRRDAADPRDRLGTEAAALRFLRPRGIHCVPRCVAAEDGWLLSEWLEGEPIAQPTARDIDAAVSFAAALRRLSGEPAAAQLPAASEACFSGETIIAQISSRRARLAESDDPELMSFLAQFDGALASATTSHSHSSVMTDEVPRPLRTLSPSDFGFHNALRRADGSLLFLDFEYFGWDDPVKLTADFLLHPGMALDLPLRQRFMAGIGPLFSEDSAFFTRLQRFFPLYGLRWCMILLNEFVPGRANAWLGDTDGAQVRRRRAVQLEKAHAMLARAQNREDSLYGC